MQWWPSWATEMTPSRKTPLKVWMKRNGTNSKSLSQRVTLFLAHTHSCHSVAKLDPVCWFNWSIPSP